MSVACKVDILILFNPHNSLKKMAFLASFTGKAILCDLPASKCLRQQREHEFQITIIIPTGFSYLLFQSCARAQNNRGKLTIVVDYTF